MVKEIELAVLPEQLNDEAFIKARLLEKVKVTPNRVIKYELHKRSIDARKRPIFRLRYLVHIDKVETDHIQSVEYQQTSSTNKTIHIIGAGPAGYFAALQCIEEGLRPIIYERGKDVRTRRRDLRNIQQNNIINPESNYCYGEGGAGTYSDGKLYTRSHKRGNIVKSLQILVDHGASSDIMIDAHPHIGSNKLPKVVAAIRETIESHGGEIRFDSKLTDFNIQGNKIVGFVLNDKEEIKTNHILLATGHSARDIYKLLHNKGVNMTAKPFALGVRIEHPQPLIDKIQYRQNKREEMLPASSYKLVCQVEKRGVFSFCMCPGGLIVPAGTSPGEIVVNGMSMSKRDSPFANSGTVVAVEREDLAHDGLFAGLEFQQQVEQKLFQAGDGSLKAPAQRLTDFVNGKVSNSLPGTSYIPGLWSAPLHELLPSSISTRLQEAIQVFGKKMKGYYTEEANVVGTESRTSSPITIPRSKETLMHEQIEGLFPCGEGAGYAGGILSAAMDGQNVAKAIAQFINTNA